MKTLTKFFSLSMFFFLLIGKSYAVGTWAAVATAASHFNNGVMLLLSDGTVIVKNQDSSGTNNSGTGWDKLTPNSSGSYINGSWTSIASMANSRLYFSSQVLKDGRVYVAGGEYGSGGFAAEVYDPVANTWTAAPNPGPYISDANSEILEDGRVLQSLVSGSQTSTRFYNPVTNTYTNGPNALGSYNESAWVKLPDNSILYVDKQATTSERYIPSLNQWVADANVPVTLYDVYGAEMGGAVLLPDGRAFFIGATGYTAYYTPSGTSSPGSWVAGTSIPTSGGSLGAPDAAAAMMVNGKVLIAVSPIPFGPAHPGNADSLFTRPTSFYEFDYTTGIYTAVNAPNGSATINIATYITNLLDLPDGTVLYGQQGSKQYYIYSPDGSPLASGKPTINAITQPDCSPLTCSNFTITGTLFNGISQGATYGDDWQMATNYPVIRLKNGANIYYARTVNWNSTGVMRGSTPDTTHFTLPAGFPAGTYDLVVTTNGIASDPVSITIGECPAAQITTGTIATTLCVGAAISVPFTSDTIFNGGNFFTAQLSDVNGSFCFSPVNIGLLGSQFAGSINATIPLNTPSGIHYRIRVISSDPASLDFDNGADITIINPNANAGPDKTIDGCIQTAQLEGSTTTYGGGTFSWVATNGGHIQSGANTATPIIDSAGTFILTVTSNIGGCTAKDTALVKIAVPISCVTCEGVVTVTSNVTVNFNYDPPLYTGDLALRPFFIYYNGGSAKNLWKAIFDLGIRKLLVKNGVTITTTLAGGYAPGIVIKGRCDLEVENGGHIVVASANKDAGDILIQINGNVLINGEVRNEVAGTLGLPGAITIDSKCGDVTEGRSGLIQDLGVDFGGNTISLLACGTDCNYYGSGNITVAGLVKSFAHAHVDPLTANRPNIRVASFNGTVTVNASTTEPLFDEFSMGGGRYDIYGGLLSWVRDNVNPGKVEVQSRLNINVNGHGTDPTGAVQKSFGAIAAVGTASSSPGGLVDVRSLQGNILANNRAFDVSGRNLLSTNFARINLYSMFKISLSRVGLNNNFNPVVDASSPVANSKGGKNDLRSYRDSIIIGMNAVVSAAVPAGFGSVPGINLLQSCKGLSILGTVNPADLIGGDNSGSCATKDPTAIYTDCFGIGGGSFREASTGVSEESIDVAFGQINVYPNPTDGKITLQFNSTGSDNYIVSVFDMTGRITINDKIVATEGSNIHEIDLSNVAKGMYILILENASTKEQKRIIVQ